MTSIVKKVFRGGSGKKHGSSNSSKRADSTTSSNNSIPQSPPSPDFSGLTPEEVTILKDVLKRQEQFETEEVERREKLCESLQIYEDEVKKSASQKSKIKQVDLRLCKLCFKTKFADGIGKVCYDCHKRVCNKCGSFSRPKHNSKKNKHVKGNWRCNMCQMKRDVVAMTGGWYHGNEWKPGNPTDNIKKKLSISEFDSSENEVCYLYSTGTDLTQDECHDRTNHVNSNSSHGQASSPKFTRGSIRRSSRTRRHVVANSDESNDDKDDVDGEKFQRERQAFRMLRQNRKSRRRLKSGSSFSKSIDDGEDIKYNPGSSDPDPSSDACLSSIHRASSDRETSRSTSPLGRISAASQKSTQDGEAHHSADNRHKTRKKYIPKYYSEERFTDDQKNESRGEKGFRCRKRQKDILAKTNSSISLNALHPTDDVPYQSSHSFTSKESLRRESPCIREPGTDLESNNERESRHSRESRVLRDSRYSLESTASRDSLDYPVKTSSLHQRRYLHRQQETYYSSSSSVFSDLISCDVPDTSSSKIHAHASINVTEGDRNFAQQLQLPKSRDVNISSSNNLSPQMALNRNRRKRNRRRRDDESLSPRRSLSPCRTSDQERGFGPKVADSQRRMTLSHCENIILPDSSRFGECVPSSKPHDIILHRDCSDSSVRYSGLGMRVVGGQSCGDGSLGAFVTTTTKGGPATRQGISQGDQIVQWNGRSLVDVTFEEAQEIISQSGNIVQVSVIHNPHDRPFSSSSKSLDQPIIVRAGTLDYPSTLEPSKLFFNKPKRRMLPKTPIEIKRDVRRISGSIWMQLDYDVKCQCLLVVVLRGEDISCQDTSDGHEDPSPVAMLHLLPNRAVHPAKESEQKFHTKSPNWNETFVFSDISEEEINVLSLEVTLWNVREADDEFLGEVLLDLGEALLDNTPMCYHLEDHDDNSSPLPYRKKSFSLSDTSAVSPVTSIETSSVYPSQNPSPRSSLSTKAAENQRMLPLAPGQDRHREMMQCGKRSPGVSSSAQSSPLYSPTSPGHDYHSSASFSSIVRKKMSAVARISSSLMMHGTKREASSGAHLSRSHSYTDISNTSRLDVPSPASPRRSFDNPRRQSLLAPPHPLSRSNSSMELFSDMSGDTDNCRTPDRPAPEGDDITSLLGPGQIAPKVSFETEVCGDIKMGFMVSKGQLEIDVVVVKGLTKNRVSCAPDTYVKTYLVEGSKTVQKKKTHTVKMNFDPIFRKTIKYSACNIHGRCIKVNVWEKQKTFDKKQCLGEAIVKLDNLDLTNHTMAWYKLFPAGATEFGSSESLNYWGYQ